MAKFPIMRSLQQGLLMRINPMCKRKCMHEFGDVVIATSRQEHGRLKFLIKRSV